MYRNPSPDRVPISQQKVATNSWVILVLLTLGWLISFIDRTSLSAAMADKPFVSLFALSNIERGWLTSAIFWSYALFQIPMGWLVDRYGLKRPYAICFALWCIGTAVTGLATTLGALIVMRLLVGATEAIVIPASYRYIANHFSESKKGTAVGILSLGGKLGPALGAPIGAYFIVHYSWQAMFFITGIVGLLWLVPWLLLFKEDPTPGHHVDAAEAPASTVPIRNLLVSPVVWGGMVNNFAYSYFVFYCMSWMPAYLVEQRGLSLGRSGLFTFLSFVSVAVVAILAGWAADRIIARGRDPVIVRKCFIVAGSVGGMTVVLGAYADTVNMALFWNVMSLTLAGLTTANNLALCKLTLIPRQAIGLNTGIQQLASSIGGGAAASLSGWLLHIGGSYTLPMQAIFVFLALGICSTLFLMRREWAPKVDTLPPTQASADTAARTASSLR